MKDYPFEDWPIEQQQAGGYTEIQVRDVRKAGTRTRTVRQLVITKPLDERSKALWDAVIAILREKPV